MDHTIEAIERQPPQPILLVGLSMRMLAELAVRAGYRVAALDYFGDVDLQQFCPTQSLLRDFGQSYSAEALALAAAQIEAPGVIYGASLENHPEVVASLAQGRRLLGNSPAVLRQVRDPIRLAAALREQGFLFPQTLRADDQAGPDPARSWLWKPLHSGGGHGIRPWPEDAPSEAGIIQEFLPGLVCSAAFVADGHRAVVLGVTEQLIGQAAFGAAGFQYCGNLLPPRLSPPDLTLLLKELQALADYLTRRFGLTGVNGLDFVWRQHRVWTLEVNPRPSASLELIDRAYDLRVFAAHVRAVYGRLPDFDLARLLFKPDTAVGKTILFAPTDIIVGDTRDWLAQGRRDIPQTGEQIEQGHPVCTLLAEGATPAACLQQLQVRAGQVRQQLISVRS